ncbi:cytochrome P450 [Nonomuraea sp. NPDC048882]|uniref:cytochrome P450 n=1 Tax=Nonomuraea sp. NPDC048882 TaxID=3154347 RepID=UPI0033C01681
MPSGRPGRPVMIAASHAAARAVLSHPRFSARGDLKRSPIPMGQAGLGEEMTRPGMFIHLDPPEQTRYRRLLTPQFTLRRMRRLEPGIAKITAVRLDAMERHGPPADLVELFALPIPSLVICELLGVPYADRDRFQRDTAVIMSIEATPDQVMEDVEIDGQVIKAGEVVTVSLPAANRDPEHFDDPDVLDLTRHASGHLSFGHGVHQCIGQQLARIELRIACTALFERFPALRLAVPAAEVPMRTDMTVYGVHRLPVTW